MFLEFVLLFIKFSEYCQSPSKYESPIEITSFDIPFQDCSITDFNQITFRTTYNVIKNYSHRTLRLDGQINLIIDNVISGDILDMLDIIDATVTLNANKNLPTSLLTGNFRVNQVAGSHLIINNSSFRANPQKLIRLIHTNDIHCAYVEGPSTATIGLPKLKTFIEQQKQLGKEHGFSVFSFDCGDFNQGLPLCNVNNGSTGIEALKIMNFDAFTLGNHEWDYGHHNMYLYYKYIKDHKLPLIVSNIDDQTSEERMNFTPYIIKEVNSIGNDDELLDQKVKIGIFALLTPYTNVTTNPLQVKDVHFQPEIIDISQKYVKILREDEKCDVVILICHLGYESLDLTSNSIAESFDGIDVIIDGHSHTTLKDGATRLNNDYTTLIAQAGSSLQNIGVVDILIDSNSHKVVSKQARLLNYADVQDVENNKEIESYLLVKEKEIDIITSVVVGETLIDLNCERSILRKTGQSEMAYLVTTSMLYAAQKDSKIAVINGGGIRTMIRKGNITYGDLVSVLPFGNMIVVVKASGKDLHELLRFGTRLYNTEEFGGFPTTSGITFTLNLNENWQSMNRITELKIVGIDGSESEPVYIDDEHFYNITMIDFMYDGGDGYDFVTKYEKVNQYSTGLNGLRGFIESFPNRTVTGSEAFFSYPRIIEKGELSTESVSTKKTICKSQIVYNHTVEINNGAYDMTNFNNMTRAHYNFTVKADSYRFSSRDSLQSVLDNNIDDLVIVGSDGSYIATNSNRIVYADSVNSSFSQFHLPEVEIKCEGIFKKIKNGQCQFDPSLIIFFAFMCLFLAISVSAIGYIILLKSAKRNHNAQLTDVDRSNPLIERSEI